MPELDRIEVRVLGDVTDLHKKLSKGEKTVEQFGYNMTQAGRTLTVGLTLPLLGVGAAAGKAAVDFESSFAGIRKTMDLTEAEFGRLAQANRDLAKTIPVSVNQLNKIGELAGQLGVRGVDNVLKFEETIAKLAVTTDLTAETAALSFAQIANVLQLPQDQIDRLGAAVVGLGNSFATVESRIVEFTTRIAGAGKIAGLTAGDVAGIGTAFASLGVGAEAGGTAVQKVLLAMVSAAESGGDELETFAATAGMSVADFTRLFEQDAAQAFTAFVEGLGRQGTAAIATLEALGLQDQRLVRSFLAAAGAGDTLSRAVAQGNREFEANTALTEEAAKRFKTFESQLTLTWNRLKDLAITVGDQVLPMVAQLTEKLNGLLKATDGLSSSTIQWTIAFGAVAASLGPVLLIVGKLTRAVVLLRPAIIGLSATLGLSTGGLWFVVVGITAALGFLATAFVKTRLEAAQFAAQMDAQWAQTESGIKSATAALREMSQEQRRATVGNILAQILSAQAAHRQLVAELEAEESRRVEGKTSTGFADPARVKELREAVERSQQSLKAWQLAYVEAAKTLTETDAAASDLTTTLDALGSGMVGAVDTTNLELGRVLDRIDGLKERLTDLQDDIAFATTTDQVGELTEALAATRAELDLAVAAARELTAVLPEPKIGLVDSGAFGVAEQLRDLDALRQWVELTGGFDATEIAKKLGKAADEGERLGAAGRQVASAFSSSLVAALQSSQNAFKTFVDYAIQQLLRLAAQMAALSLLSAIFPGSGALIGAVGGAVASAGAGVSTALPDVSGTGTTAPVAPSRANIVFNVPPAQNPIVFARDKDWQRAIATTLRELGYGGA